MAHVFNQWDCDDFDGLTCAYFDSLICADSSGHDVVLPITGSKVDHESCIVVQASRNSPHFIHGSQHRPPYPEIGDDMTDFNTKLMLRLNRPRRYKGDAGT